MDVLDLVEDHQRQHLTDTGSRADELQGHRVMLAGLLQDRLLDLQQYLVEGVEDLDVGLYALPHHRFLEVLG